MTADFLNSPRPEPIALEIGPEDPARFFNRELSWLGFNWRVLEEAENPAVPLLERVRFVSISASNLDEFYTVRVAGIRQMVNSGVGAVSDDGLTATQQLEQINADARRLMDRQLSAWTALKTAMAAEGLHILSRDDLTDADREHLETVFMDHVFPVVTPLAIDPAHPFPFIPNMGFALAISLDGPTELEALLPIPSAVQRFFELPDGGGRRFLPLEELLLAFLAEIFPGYRLTGKCIFRVLRDSDLEVEEEAEDLVREFESALKRRRRGEVVRLKLTADSPEGLRSMVARELGAAPGEVVEVDGLIGLADLKELVVGDRPDLLWPPFTPRMPERVQDFDGDIFAAIRQKDMLLHHPYETFDIVVRFLQQAARDPDVVAIKQTLYRTSKNSPIVAALCEAAEDGKNVTALVELKARFDEAANIRQSRQLERAGAQVVFGFTDWKTHAKISTVVRRENGGLTTYTHWGTGNYHPITANIYTDVSLFTCDPDLGRDASKVFNYVSGYAKPETLDVLAISPHSLKARILQHLEEEAEHARAGRPARVWVKMNSLIEPEVIDGLYRASQAGVEIDLVIRGICGVRPGVRGLSETIRVKSIVGRFLEHSRIACFGGGGGLPSEQARIYISSADWMGRNLNRRIETLVEIRNPTVRAQILEQVMAANLIDTAQSWVLDGHGAWHRPGGDFSAHQFFMENPSMSGRGQRGADDAPRLIGG